MTDTQQTAYEWAKNQTYTSVAATYARELAGLVDELRGEIERLQSARVTMTQVGSGTQIGRADGVMTINVGGRNDD